MLSKQEREEFLARIKEEGIFVITEADEKYRDDEIIMKGLVTLNGGLLAYASDRLKRNETIIKAALESKNDHLGTSQGRPYGFAIQFVDKEYLKNHLEYVYRFMDKNLEYASNVLGSDILTIPQVHQYVLENLEKAPMLWFSLDDNERFRKNVVLKVIHEMPNMVGELPFELQTDPDVIKEASRDHDPDFHAVEAMYDHHLDEKAKKNPDVCRILVDADPRVFPYLKYRDKYIIKKGLAYNGDNLAHLDDERDDKDSVLIAVSQNGLSLEYASDRLRDDPEVVYAAVSNNGWAINNASSRLQKSPEMINKAMDVSPELSNYGWKRPSNNKR